MKEFSFACSVIWISFEVAAAFVAILVLNGLLLWQLRIRSQASVIGLPPGSFGVPIVGETIMYMSSMRGSKPAFMAERHQR